MHNLKLRIFTNWSYIRAFYGIMGALILFSSFPSLEYLGILFGAYILSMSIFGFGCASGYCIDQKKWTSDTIKDGKMDTNLKN